MEHEDNSWIQTENGEWNYIIHKEAVTGELLMQFVYKTNSFQPKYTIK